MAKTSNPKAKNNILETKILIGFLLVLALLAVVIGGQGYEAAYANITSNSPFQIFDYVVWAGGYSIAITLLIIVYKLADRLPNQKRKSIWERICKKTK